MSESKFHKRFDPEYKQEIVRLVEELGKSPSEVARDCVFRNIRTAIPETSGQQTGASGHLAG